ncbi:heme/hemin ABC transporter substrate-binding protein [Sandarakinorhabdus sp.]|uniref:heme/hemin ABC transporter substrate-binding protein n=1 Tax=Sandarakinorhabdus sp. TaxID=1916663 RepID=UPI003F710939
MINRRRLIARGLALAALPSLAPGLAPSLSPALAQPARRVVALGSDVAETLFAIGAGAAVVATDDTANFPAAAESLPKLGYLRSLAPEPIIAARPGLIIAADGAGPDAVLRQVESAGVTILRLPAGHAPADVAARIRLIGNAVGAAAAADRLARDVLARLALPLPARWAPPRCLLVLAQAPGRILAAGQNSAGDSFIRLAGGQNIFRADGYKPLSAEAAIAGTPAIIIVPSHVIGLAGGLERLKADPVFAGTPAGRTGRFHVVDSQAALGFGPRLPDAVAAARKALAPLAVLRAT